MRSRLCMFRVLTAGWMTLIIFLSSQTSLPAPASFSGADLLAHAAFYAVLGVFLARSLAPQLVMTWKRVIFVTILVAAYGITDEYHQLSVPGRDASGWDILADGLGGFLAASILFRWDRRTMKISHMFSRTKKSTLRVPQGYPVPGGGEEGQI